MGPLFPVIDEACFHGVLYRVVDDTLQLRTISDIVVIALGLPKRAGSIKQLIHQPGRASLYVFQCCIKLGIVSRCDRFVCRKIIRLNGRVNNDTYMISHYIIGQPFIVDRVIFMAFFLGTFRYGRFF